MIRNAAIVAAAMAAALSAAEAANLSVTPSRLDLSQQVKATSLRLSNHDSQPVTVQARVFRWTQSGGEDVLVRADEIVASPPITTLGPNSEGLFRIVRLDDGAAADEQAYRVFVEQVPEALNASGANLTISVRYSIPLFVRHGAGAPPDLSWTARRAGDHLVVEARNDGGLHAKLTRFELRSADGRSLVKTEGLVGYVLPGSVRSWSFPISGASTASGAGLVIEAHTQSGVATTDATVR